jgi:hypothetical protein
VNNIPVVTLSHCDGGWSLHCGKCGSEDWYFTRVEADRMAVAHQKSCTKNGEAA